MRFEPSKLLRLLALPVLFLLLSGTAQAQGSYRIDKLNDRVYAAIARPGMRATSNAFFVVGSNFVAAGGAHMTKEAIADLFAAVAEVTSKPVRYFVLSHHHRGFSHIDFDFPPGVELVMAAQTWQALTAEVRKSENQKVFFSEGLSLDIGGTTLVLTNLEQGHSKGDLVVYLPQEDILYTGDLLYVRSVGYMGDGHMRSWLMSLDFINTIGARTIIPGFGDVCSAKELAEFTGYFRDFTSEILAHLERGESLQQTVKTFNLDKYKDFEGFERLLRPNIERAYHDLKQDLATD